MDLIFTQLKIGKPETLKKEVDVALSSLNSALLEGDGRKLSRILQTISLFIDELDEFRSQYDSDDRAILFEKERLRLRKGAQDAQAAAAQTQSNSANSSKQGATIAPPAAAAAPIPVSAPSFSSSSSYASTTPSTKSSLFGPTTLENQTEGEFETKSDKALSLSALQISSSGGGDREKRKGSSTPGGRSEFRDSRDSSSGTRAPAPRTKLVIDGHVFAPCAEIGVYMSDKLSAAELAAPETFIDMQIVLTRKELDVLASRLYQRRSHPEIKDADNALSSASSLLATPFVDQGKLLKDLYRPTQTDKWTASHFRPNAK